MGLFDIFISMYKAERLQFQVRLILFHYHNDQNYRRTENIYFYQCRFSNIINELNVSFYYYFEDVIS